MLIKDKSFYKMLIGITLPITLQNLINVAVGMADTLMLGQLGEVELSASALSGQLFFIFLVVNFGLGGGSSILISQYWGKQDVTKIRTIIGIMYKVSMSLSIIFILIALCIPRQFIGIFTDDIRVINLGENYLRIISIGYIFYSLTNCTVMAFRSVKTVNISIVIYGLSLFINIFLNWIFIFGNLGAPELGVIGAAIATVIARITEFTIVLIYIKFFDKKIRLNLDIFKTTDKDLRNDFIITTTPVVINELIWSIGSAMITVIVGRLGTEVVAANSIGNVVNQFVTVFIYALSGAASVIIGNTIGAGEYQKTKDASFTIIFCITILGVLAGIIVFISRSFVVSFYNVSELTKTFAMQIMLVNSFIICFQAVANTTNVGMLRAGGDVKFVLINDLIFMWLIAIPVGFIGAFVWGLPVIAVFCIIRIDEILKSTCAIIRLLSFKWIRNMTR
ncbi:MATE family efflux transporter [Candidatus Epulonipiscioides gigas]|nr:MATE family efflux transporter [Epulopiscium sp. SCG-C07WGA-EpuloA2]